MDFNHWKKVIRELSWLTQFGISVAFPLILFLMGAFWLQREFSLGAWIYAVGLILGVGTAISSFCSFLRYIKNKK